MLSRIFKKKSWPEIDSRQSLEQTALKFGALPFFRNNVKGFSVDEMAAPGMLFGGDEGYEGCWEWKGPVIQEKTTIYGKFFRRKAGFISIEFLTDFLNYRRNAYPVKPESVDEMILEIIRENDGMSSTELRKFILGSPGKKDFDEEGNEIKKPSRSSLEGPLQRLQMGGHLLISDFQYKYTKRGEKYGWGVALYSTPELWLGQEIKTTVLSPEDSLERMAREIAARVPGASKKQLKALLK